MNIAQLKTKLEEVYLGEPNDLQLPILTKTYKYTTRCLKRMPFLYIIPFTLVVSVLLYVFFGFSVVRLVSILQYGF